MFIASYPCKVRHAVSDEKKPLSSLTSRLMRAMILLDEIVEVLALPQFVKVWHATFRFQLLSLLSIPYQQ
jgi:hypothetical protein